MSSTPEEDIKFIKEELLPEMVHDRCFCEPGSREFVEFDQADVSVLPRETDRHLDYAFYRAKVSVLFSGEPEIFHVVVKLLPADGYSELAFNAFLNEEILWNKTTLQFGKEFLPKFYVADMGRYGRPVIVVEDLEKNGYERVVDRRLNKAEAKKVLEVIGEFHGKGLALKEKNFPVYREFQAKFQEITFAEEIDKETRDKLNRFNEYLHSSVRDTVESGNADDTVNKFRELIDENVYLNCKTQLDREPTTICNGYLLRENLWFKRSSAGIEDVKIFDWQKVRCGSNCLDLNTVIVECGKTDFVEELSDSYVKAVQKSHPTAKREDLLAGLEEPGFGYAVVVTAIQDRSFDSISDFLMLRQ